MKWSFLLALGITGRSCWTSIWPVFVSLSQPLRFFFFFFFFVLFLCWTLFLSPFPCPQELVSQFDIEQILQYSYSQQNSTFSFSYLEEGRFFVTHKFHTPDVRFPLFSYPPVVDTFLILFLPPLLFFSSFSRFTSTWAMPLPLLSSSRPRSRSRGALTCLARLTRREVGNGHLSRNSSVGTLFAVKMTRLTLVMMPRALMVCFYFPFFFFLSPLPRSLSFPS